MPKQGEVVLIPVPFTDLSSTKRRPVIVISNDDYHQTTVDMVVVAMTSFANRLAIARPMPDPAPVITATFPAKRILFSPPSGVISAILPRKQHKKASYLFTKSCNRSNREGNGHLIFA